MSHWRYLQFWGARVENDVDDELRFHHDMLVRDLVARGMSESDARGAAARRVGDLRAAREACVGIGQRRQRRMTRAQTFDALRQDFSFALRTLRRTPLWTCVAVLTLALGIGAATSIFSVVNAVVLRPLPYAHLDRTFLLWLAEPKSGMMVSPDGSSVDAWAKSARSIEAMQQFGGGEMTLTNAGDPAVIPTVWVDRDITTFTGTPLLLGRSFTAAEQADSMARVVILGEGLWRERFAGSRDVLGKTIDLDGNPYTVIGVASSNMRLPTWTSLSSGQTRAWLPRGSQGSMISHMTMVRLVPGATVESAERELATIQARQPKQPRSGFAPKLLSVGRFNGWGDSLALLSAAVGLLLLIACANVAHLVIARNATRRRELAIRTALGASRTRLARQLLTESVLLAVAGCVCGLAVAAAGLRVFVAMRPKGLDQITYAGLDARVLTIAVSVAALTGIVFGLIGAAQVAVRQTADTLRGTSLSGTGTKQSYRARSILVVSEMALSAMLLVGAMLLIRTVINLQQIDPGFDTKHLYSVHFQLRRARYMQESAVKDFAHQALEQARRIPGVAQATTAASAPPEASFMIGQLELQGRSTPAGLKSFNALNQVRPDFFSMLRMGLAAGRAFDEGSEKRGDVIINQGMAHRLWPNESAIGKRFRFAPPPGIADKGDNWMTVVGVTGDAVVRGLNADRSEPFIFLPSNDGVGFAGFTLILRTRGAVDVASAVRRISLAIDPSLAPPTPTSIDSALNDSIAAQRFTMAILAIFASLAVLLAAIGLYGVIAYMVLQRTREIGIRVALGATPRHVARLVVVGGIVLSAIGLAIGLVTSVWGTKLIQKSLYGIQPNDPASFAAGGALLLGVAVVACLIPMRRALRVDPLIAMRAE